MLDAELSTGNIAPPPTRIGGEVILVYAGIVLILFGGLALLGGSLDIISIVMPVPGFERMTLASAIGLMLFGVALAMAGIGGPRIRRSAVGTLMVLLALGEFAARQLGASSADAQSLDAAGQLVPVADPLLLLLAALACAFHGSRVGIRRLFGLALPVTLVVVALLVLVRSVPTGGNPDPQSGASAQWALGALVGGLALVAASTARLVGGLVVNRRLPWLVGASSSLLVILMWAVVVRTKDGQVEAMVQAAVQDASLRITQRAQRLMVGVSEGGWTSSPAPPDGVPWDSLLPGVVGVAVEREGRVTITRARDVSYAAALDSLARNPFFPAGQLVPLDPPGAPLRLVAVRAIEPSDSLARVIVIADTDSLFRDVLAPSAETMIGVLRNGVAASTLPDDRRYLVRRALDLPGLPATLEMWPSRRTLLSLRSILPELLLVSGLGFAALAAVALAAAMRSRRLEYSAQQKSLLEALSAPQYPRFRYEWDVPSGRVVRDPRLLVQLGYDAGMSGIDAAEWDNLILPADLPARTLAFDAHAAGEADASLVQYRVRAADGTWHRWIDRALITERNRDGTPRRVSGLCADLGPAEESNHWSDELDRRLERAAGHAVEMQALFGADDRLLIASPGVDPFLVQREGSPTGLELLQVAAVEERETLMLLWREARSTGAARGDVRLFRPGGDVGVMDVSLLLLGEAGDHREMLLQMRDVTTVRGAERRHIESQRLLLLGRLAGRVAHEINNPLGGLKNAAALLRRLGHNEGDRQRYADTIDREVENIAQVVRQLYETLEWGDVSRLDASVPDVVQTALQTLSARYGEIAVDVRIASDARRVAAPEAVVRLVVYTLLRNALNASPQGGTVLITGRRFESDIVLNIDDQGPGVPVDLRDSILQKTVRHGKKARSDLILGLPFAREVLEVFDGTLTIESTPAGGASFVTKWPAAMHA